MKASTQQMCDTSVLIPALVSWHEHHAVAAEAMRAAITHAPAHVLCEAYSVLTRLPAPHRIAPNDAIATLNAVRLTVVALSADRHLSTLQALASNGIKGGATYDGLVAATAVQHGCTLNSLDRRAIATYEAVGADVRLLSH